MSKIIKVGKIPGKLVQVTLDSSVNYTAREVFNLAEIEIDDNYTINDGSSKIGLDDTVHGSILVASAKIKGNSDKIVKVGKIPGKLVQVVLDSNTSYSAREVFALANIEIDDNYTINDGSSKISLDDTVHGSILVASAKIKGNSDRIVKVGKIPGKLVQVLLDSNTNYSAREVFALANIEIDDNYTINDGSSKIGLDDTVHGSILVASAKIKGNSVIYVLKEYINSDEIFEIPSDMIDGQFNLILDMGEEVSLEDINTNEAYVIRKSLFENLFEVYNEENMISNNQIENRTNTQPTSNLNCNDKEVLKRLIEIQISYLQQDIRDYNTKIANASNQIELLKNLLS